MSYSLIEIARPERPERSEAGASRAFSRNQTADAVKSISLLLARSVGVGGVSPFVVGLSAAAIGLLTKSMHPQQQRTVWHLLSRMAPKRPSTSVVMPPKMARISAVLLTTLPIVIVTAIRGVGNISCSCIEYVATSAHGPR